VSEQREYFGSIRHVARRFLLLIPPKPDRVGLVPQSPRGAEVRAFTPSVILDDGWRDVVIGETWRQAVTSLGQLPADGSELGERLEHRTQRRPVRTEGVQIAWVTVNIVPHGRLRGQLISPGFAVCARAPQLLGGFITEGHETLPLFRVGRDHESVTVLAASPARVEHARAMCGLGMALRQARRRVEARGPLRKALDLALRCGGARIASQAREELVLAGARPRRDRISGRDALTAAELRVARLASQGNTNREIAEHLFLTVRTDETHLTRTYGKLDVTSRSQLRHKLQS
jgi:DNA-binding CsgD family transcriptional regulator